METKQVIVMRADLNMRKGKMVAQGAHASLAFLTRNLSIKNNIFSISYTKKYVLPIFNWITNSFAKVCVRVDSEEELLEIYQKAKDAGLLAELIIDSGKTEFGGVPTKTCVAIGPDECSKIDKITGGLKLL